MSLYHPLTVTEVRPETRDAVVVTFAVPPALAPVFRYLPGQHLNLRAHIAGEEVRRTYSICAAVGEQTLRVAIKRQRAGRFSNWANDQLQPGMTLDAMPPAGRFHVPLDPSRRRRFLAVAAGSGITPVLGLLRSILETEPLSQATLIYGNRASSSILFRGELADLKDRYLNRFSLVHVLSREHQDLDLLNGRITAQKLPQLLRFWGPASAFDAVFLCGPAAMNKDLRDALEALGVPRDRILTELFAASRQGSELPPLPEEARPACLATLILDGRSYQFPVERGGAAAESILDAGLRAGIDLRYSCKDGVCATCRAKLLQGQVDMDGNFALEDYEIARGFILTCQSFPVTPTVTVDFDQDT